MSKERLIIVIALVVVAIWAITALVGFIERDYTPLTAVTPVMLIVCGFLFGRSGAMNGERQKDG